MVAKYNAEELLSKRESVSTRIRDELTERAKQFHLIMDDVSITHLTFGHEFTKAIENKQVHIIQGERGFGVCRRNILCGYYGGVLRFFFVVVPVLLLFESLVLLGFWSLRMYVKPLVNIIPVFPPRYDNRADAVNTKMEVFCRPWYGRFAY